MLTMMRCLLAAAAFALLAAPALAQSTINGSIPPPTGPLQSAPIRGEFQAAKSDINRLFGMSSGVSPPTSPVPFQFWANTASPTAIINLYDGTQQVPIGLLNRTAHTFSPTLSASSFAATAPVVATFPGGVATFACPTCATTTNGGALSGSLPVTVSAAGVIGLAASSINNSFLAAGAFSNITGTGTLASGATGAGFTIALGASTITGNLPLTNIASIGANTILGQTGAGTPQALTINGGASCANALIWTNGTGFGCNVGVGTGSVTAGGGGLVPASGNPTTLFIEEMTPGGRLTLVSGGCSINTDQVAQTNVYYSPCGSEWVPIYDGTDMKLHQFTSSATDTVGLTVALGSNWGLGTLYDWFIGIDSGTVRLCSVVWLTSNPPSARGTGVNSNELELYKGLWTNKNATACRYSNSSTFTCAAHQCTYVGTIIMAQAGQVDLKFGTSAVGGGYARLSVCNMYNRQDVRATVQDSQGSWTYNSGTFRVADQGNGGNNFVQVVSCMGDVGAHVIYNVVGEAATGNPGFVSIGLNNTSQASRAVTSIVNAQVTSGTIIVDIPITARLDDIAPLGLTTIFALEAGNPSTFTFLGGGYQQLSFFGRM